MLGDDGGSGAVKVNARHRTTTTQGLSPFTLLAAHTAAVAAGGNRIFESVGRSLDRQLGVLEKRREQSFKLGADGGPCCCWAAWNVQRALEHVCRSTA